MQGLGLSLDVGCADARNVTRGNVNCGMDQFSLISVCATALANNAEPYRSFSQSK
jgi:hypothetical protein